MPDRVHAADGARPTVRSLLDDSLCTPRVQSLEAACAELAARPLDGTLAELRQVVARPVSPEECRRLHVLISSLYHHSSASLELTTVLRHEVSSALRTRHRTEE